MDTPQFSDHFVVEEFLDFSNDDDNDAPPFDVITPDSTSNSSSSFSGGYDPNFIPDAPAGRNFPDAHFSSDLCVPYDDIADMEWLSNIVEESFSSEDLQRLQLISGVNARSAETDLTRSNNLLQSPDHDPEHDHVATSVPGKARSKRSRAPPCNWSSHLLLVSPDVSEDSVPAPAPGKKGPKKKEVAPAAVTAGEGGGSVEGRRCVHCATDKTPQWRTGPLGPKTLCNACGVRYKSGRLVPEYRPAASPTFVLTKHSNSHRKVLELRRQKDFGIAHHHHQFIHNNCGSAAGEHEYLIHHRAGSDYRHMI